MTFKELRQKSGMTQQQFADYFGIPKRTVEDWERGVSKCAGYLLDLMEYKLDSEYEKFVYRAKNPTPPRGYRYDENGKLQIDEAEATEIKAFFKEYTKNAPKECPPIPKLEPIVSEELFNAMQHRRKNQKTSTDVNSENPTFQTRCGKCGIELMCLDSVKEHLDNCPNCGAKINK